MNKLDAAARDLSTAIDALGDRLEMQYLSHADNKDRLHQDKKKASAAHAHAKKASTELATAIDDVKKMISQLD